MPLGGLQKVPPPSCLAGWLQLLFWKPWVPKDYGYYPSHPIDSLGCHPCSVLRARSALREANQLFERGTGDTISSTPAAAEIRFWQLAWIWRGSQSHSFGKVGLILPVTTLKTETK